jgi:hypothetical protein
MHLDEMKFKENQQQYQLHNTIFFSNTKESYVSLCEEEEERYKKSIQQPHTHTPHPRKIYHYIGALD